MEPAAVICDHCQANFSQWKYEGASMLKVHMLTDHLLDDFDAKYKPENLDLKDLDLATKIETSLKNCSTKTENLLITADSCEDKESARPSGRKRKRQDSPSSRSHSTTSSSRSSSRSRKVFRSRSSKRSRSRSIVRSPRRSRSIQRSPRRPRSSSSRSSNSSSRSRSPSPIDKTLVRGRLLSLIPEHRVFYANPIKAYINKWNDPTFYKRFGSKTALDFLKTHMSDVVEILPALHMCNVHIRRKKLS